MSCFLSAMSIIRIYYIFNKIYLFNLNLLIFIYCYEYITGSKIQNLKNNWFILKILLLSATFKLHKM